MFSILDRFIPKDRDWQELQTRGAHSSLSQIIIATLFFFMRPVASESYLPMASLIFICIASVWRYRFSKRVSYPSESALAQALTVIVLQAAAWAIFIYYTITTKDADGFGKVLGYVAMAAIMTGATQSLSTSDILFRSYIFTITIPAHIFAYQGFVAGRIPMDAIIVYMFFGFLLGQRRSQIKQWNLITSTEQDLQTIINNFPGAISLVRNGKYVHANQKVAELSGLPLSQILNQNVGKSRPDEEIPKLIAELEISSEQDLLMKEVKFRSGKGTSEHLVFLNRLANKDIIVISLDISSQREIERQLEQQKIRAQSSAKMAALGEMSSGLAHEINNPLAIISAKSQRMVQIVEKEVVNKEELIKQANSIKDTVKRIAVIVKGLRQFARDGEKDPFQPVTVQSIVQDTLALCETRFKNHEIELRKKNTDTEIQIECRSVQISQVLLNLLNNAHDAIEKLPEKWIEIEVVESENKVKIFVTDSGPGIPAEIRDKLMQPFFTTKDVGKGTGLGLSLSKGLIEDHGGKFYFDFKFARTRVVIELPKKQAAASGAAA